MTDKSKRSISSTDSTSSIREAKYLCGESMESEKLTRAVIRISLCDLFSADKSLRDDAMRYILSIEFTVACMKTELPREKILETVNSAIGLKTIQNAR